MIGETAPVAITMNIVVIHGPNLNLLGKREPEIYGSLTLDEINHLLIQFGEKKGLTLRIFSFQSEGAIIECIHNSVSWAGGIIINPAAYTHYSYAIRDAISASGIPAVEVHLSNIHGREEFRSRSVIAPVAIGQISGFGYKSYILALEFLSDLITEGKS